MQERIAKTFYEVLKFNPYHDRLGRFTFANGAASFTYKPGASRAHDLAIEREKQRHASSTATATATQTEKPQNKPQKKLKVAPKEETPRVKAVHAVEKKIHKQNFESAAVIDDNGNQLYFKDGGYSEVRFSRLECMQMANNTMIHNHPRCSMFSYEDLACMVGNQLYETRIVNRDGTVYSMKRAAGGYSTEKAAEFIHKYKNEYRNGTIYAQRDLDSRGFQDKIGKGEISHQEANIEFGRSSAKYMADWAAKEAPKYGLEFTVEVAEVATTKSFNEVPMAKAKDDDYLILDRDTNDLEDKAFKEWLERATQRKEKTAKTFSDVLTGRSE